MLRSNKQKPAVRTVITKSFLVIVVLASSLGAMQAEATQHRSAKAVRAFKAQHPCPATGQVQGACKGYIIDHVVPLCAGGEDSPANMQWQTVEDAKAKDKQEWAQCRLLKNKRRNGN